MPARSATSIKAASATTGQAKKRSAPRRRTARRRQPEHSRIAERAYFIHIQEGCSDEVSNWLRAERELMAA